jgi:hypothetical protein
MLNLVTLLFCIVRHYAPMLFCIDSLSIEVSGHGVQIKETNGDEDNGLDECSLATFLECT